MSPVCKTVGSLPPGDHQEGICTDILKGRCDSIQARGVCLLEGRLCRRTQAQSGSREVACRVYVPGSPCSTGLSHNGCQCLAKRTAAVPLHEQLKTAVLLGSRDRLFFFTRNNSILSGICLYYHCIDIEISGQERVSAKSTRFYLRSHASSMAPDSLCYTTDSSNCSKTSDFGTFQYFGCRYSSLNLRCYNFKEKVSHTE